MFILNRLTLLLKKKPIKTILFTMIVIAIFAVGAQNIEMATGNDTLVSSDSEVYQENLSLEKEFGGESVIVMYESDNLEDLLSLDNLEHMERLEQKLEVNENIYSIVSPVMLVDQMAEKQAGKYQEGLSETINGLNEMGEELNKIGDNLITKAESGDDSPLSGQKFEEMNQGLDKMIEAQKELQNGTQGLVTGFDNYGEQISQVGIAIDDEASSLSSEQPKEQQRIKKLKKYSQQLTELSEHMEQTGSNSSALLEGTQETLNGLEEMQSKLKGKRRQLSDMQEKQQQQQSELMKLESGLKEMGGQLQTIGENLRSMQQNSDSLSPGLPETQKTLDYMIYDEDGQLQDMFDELVFDEKYMIMSITFKGEVNDSEKSNVVDSVKTYLEGKRLEKSETIVTGKPVLDEAMRSSMQDSIKEMMMLAIGIMIIVLMVIFKSRWRLLPLGIILLAVVGTVGFMGWVGISITMVSMAVFPILIGLGIDYAIQFQSRYTEELAESEEHDYDESE